MTALDTTADARRAQLAVYRRMGGAERVRLAADMSADVRSIAAAGVRARRPDWSEERVRYEVLARIYGRAFVERVWGALPVGA